MPTIIKPTDGVWPSELAPTLVSLAREIAADIAQFEDHATPAIAAELRFKLECLEDLAAGIRKDLR